MLTKFSVKNYKCLADVTLPLTPIHVLIGQNDTGKTSLLEAIRAGCRIMRLAVHEGGFVDDCFPGEWIARELVWHASKYPEIKLSAVFDNDAKERTGFSRSSIRIGFDGLKGSHVQSGESDDLERSARLLDYSVDDNDVVDPWYGSTVEGIAKLGPLFIYRFRPNMMARPCALSSSTSFSIHPDGFGLPSLLDEIRDFDLDRFHAIQTAFTGYFPTYVKIRLANSKAWSRTYEAGHPKDEFGLTGKQIWLTTVNGEIRLQQASDGVILLLGILALTNTPHSPSLILIEEPENGIHPHRLIEIAKLLRLFVEREKNAPQIIMTTHSPYLLSQFKPEEVTLMRRQPDGSAKAFPLRDAKHLRERMGDDFYLGEMWYNFDEEELLN